MDLADVSQQAELRGIVAGADVLFHLAGRPGVRGGGTDLDTLRERDNVESTSRVLAATDPETHVVVTSSSSIYGGAVIEDGQVLPLAESVDPRPRGGYARSKVRAEELCAQARESGRTITVVRPFTVAGEGQRDDMAFSIWISALLAKQPLTILGSGDKLRDVTDIRDVVRGLITAAERHVNETVNLGSGTTHRVIEMASTLRQIFGGNGRLLYAAAAGDDVDATLADTTKCEHLLGFTPFTDLPALMERQVIAAVSRSEPIPS